MKDVYYLLSDRNLDGLFGLRKGVMPELLPAGISLQEFYIHYIGEAALKAKLSIHDVFVVDQLGMEWRAGIVNVHSKKPLRPEEISPLSNHKIRLKGDYFKELEAYLKKEAEHDKIIIAGTGVAAHIKGNLERLIGIVPLRYYLPRG